MKSAENAFYFGHVQIKQALVAGKNEDQEVFKEQ